MGWVVFINVFFNFIYVIHAVLFSCSYIHIMNVRCVKRNLSGKLFWLNIIYVFYPTHVVYYCILKISVYLLCLPPLLSMLVYIFFVSLLKPILLGKTYAYVSLDNLSIFLPFILFYNILFYFFPFSPFYSICFRS